MVMIVGVQFQKNGKIYDFDSNQLDVRYGDYVIADTQRGADLGQVATGIRELDESAGPKPTKKLIRLATNEDLQRSADNRVREREAYDICQKKIAEHQLDMKLVSVEYAFDNSKAVFYFTANGRVDFRSLVKDLAGVFKMRIELRQIGVRDEARMLGGLGPCGRQICCGSFLEEFQPVSIKMAKEQNLSLNPTKISGVCGRLMCCLKYEQDHYEQTRKKMPKVGREVMTPDGSGIVTDLNIVKETLMVKIANGDSNEIKEYSLESIERIAGGNEAPPVRTTAPATAAEETDESELPADEIRNIPEQQSEPEQSRPTRPPRNNRNRPGGKPKENRNPEKSDAPRKETRQLGKPVMRENPNRNSGSSAEQSKPKKQTNWATALQEAMDSLE